MQARILCSLLICAAFAVVSRAQQPSPSVVIVSPQSGATVQTKDRVHIKMWRTGHQPIVAIRSLQEGSQWWIQEPAELKSAGEFEVPVTFGNEKTPAGTQFQIAVMIADDAGGENAMQPGAAIKQLPDDLERITVDQVSRGADATRGPDATFATEWVSPAPNSSAKRIQLVSLKTQASVDPLPSLIVRSAEEDFQWWIQEPLQNPAAGGLLHGIARLGNEKTIAGSKFVLMLIQPMDDRARGMLKTGVVLEDLKGFRCSNTMVLIAGTEAGETPDPAATDLSAN